MNFHSQMFDVKEDTAEFNNTNIILTFSLNKLQYEVSALSVILTIIKYNYRGKFQYNVASPLIIKMT